MDRKELIKSGQILSDRDELFDELRIREKEQETESVPIDAPVPSGWEIYKEYKHKKQIVKYKSKHRAFEDHLWKLFYTSGLTHMSTYPFILKGKKSDREIDVLAADEDFVFLIECTTKRDIGKQGRLKSKMDETRTKFDMVKNRIKQLFPGRAQFHIFATKDIEWTDSQLQVAKELKLINLNEYQLEYLFDLVDIAGAGAKYQIYNRILRGQKKNKKSSF